jgi:Trk-type K+ transport system membrane component
MNRRFIVACLIVFSHQSCNYVSVVQISGHVGYVSSSPFREEGEWYMTKINVIAAVGDETRVQ